MTLPASTRRSPVYVGNGVATQFPFEFEVFEATDLLVVRTNADGTIDNLVLNSDYSVSLNSNQDDNPGGTITFPISGSPLASPASLVILGDLPYDQTLALPAGGNFSPTAIERAFDRASMQIQQINDKADASLRAPVGETMSALPPAASRANRTLGFDSSGNPTVLTPEPGSAAAVLTDLANTNSAVKGAALVGFNQAMAYGAGTIGAHAKRFPTAKDAPWLAVGDGIATDTTALQAFLTANAGGVCWIPPGTYKTGALTVPANTWVIAYGATLNFAAAGNVAGLTFAGGGGIIGGTLIGAGGSVYNGSGNAVYCFGTAGATGSTPPTYVQGPVIQDVTITGWSNAGVWLGYCRNVTIRNCVIATVGYAGIGGVSCEDVWIADNEIDGVAGSGAPDWYGIFVDRAEGTETQNPRSRYVWIVRNKVFNVTNWEAIDTHGGEDFVISQNTIKGCRFGIMLVVSDVSGVPSLGCNRCVVSDNLIQGSSAGAAITVQGVAAGRARNIVISGNTIKDAGWANDPSEGAIRIYQAIDVTVTGNVLRNPYVWGINLNGDIYGCSVVGNTIIDVRDSTYSTPSAIRINASNVYAHINANTLIYQDSGTDTYVSVHSVSSAGALSGLDISFGRNGLIGIDSTHLNFNLGTTSGINTAGFYQEAGTGSLSGGTLAVTFGRRFPTTPKVTIGQRTANLCRAGSISATGFTATGTGTDAFDWQATT